MILGAHDVDVEDPPWVGVARFEDSKTFMHLSSLHGLDVGST
jgi:hypothetical protein